VPDSGTRLADVNGDGLADSIRNIDEPTHITPCSSSEIKTYLNNATKGRLLMGVKNSLGGVINITYVSSSTMNNTGEDGMWDLPFNVWVVESVAKNNGMEGSQKVIEKLEHNFSGGVYSPEDREFRGFAFASEKHPDGSVFKHYYYQDGGRKGKEFKSELYDSSNKLFSKTEYLWQTTNINGYYITNLVEQSFFDYDGKPDAKITKSAYEYDSYGNVLKETQFGDVSMSGDEKFNYAEYLYNTNSWIVNLPKHIYSYYGIDSDAGKTSETWMRYDGQSYGKVPKKGDLTYLGQWLNTGTNPVTTYGYDSYGNLINITDPLGRVSKTLYGITDSTYTFPEKTINPSGHTTSFIYDAGTGNILSSTDPNGFTIYFRYDSFGRLVKNILPYDTESSPTSEFVYFTDGNAPEAVKIKRNTGSGYLISIAYYDGFGRIIQLKSDSEENGKQIVSDIFYDSRGRPEKQSLPYLAASSDSYTNPSGTLFSKAVYDALDRPLSLINTDNSMKKFAYDRWTTSSYDENNHRTDAATDAYGRIITVKEYNGTSTFTTNYEYNGQDILIKITDNQGNIFNFTYDSLGRMILMVDPDMGTWKYSYDKAGNLISQVDNRGVKITFAYDSLNRIKNKTEGETSTLYSYDLVKGTLSKIEYDFGYTQYEYDQRLRISKEKTVLFGKTWISECTYDSADRIKTYKKPDGRTYAYVYNLQGQLESISGIIENINYNPLNKVTFKDFGTVETTLTYHSTTQRLIRIQSPSLQDLNYEYDSEGNILTIQDSMTLFNWTFRYDALDRLIQATENNTRSQNFAYDSIGNMILFSTPEANVTYTYGIRPHAVERTVES